LSSFEIHTIIEKTILLILLKFFKIVRLLFNFLASKQQQKKQKKKLLTTECPINFQQQEIQLARVATHLLLIMRVVGGVLLEVGLLRMIM
jgi:hypothetical protein